MEKMKTAFFTGDDYAIKVTGLLPEENTVFVKEWVLPVVFSLFLLLAIVTH
jgi:hypothetical protein